jgi:NADH dehydrogenase
LTRSHGPEVRIVDFSSQASIAEACRGACAIIHLVGIIAELGPNTFHEAHVALTGRMVHAAQDAGVRRFLQMSALGTRAHARSQYHRTKWGAEGLVRSSGLDWTIFRPSLVYSAHGGFVSVFEQLSRFLPFLPAIGGGRNLLQPIALDQVALAFVASMGIPGSMGQTYDLCGSERLEFRQVLQGILAAFGRRRLIVPIPWAVARAQAGVLEFVWPRLLRRAPPLSRDQILMLEEDNIGDGTPADAAFGLRHPPFQVGLQNSSLH